MYSTQHMQLYSHTGLHSVQGLLVLLVRWCWTVRSSHSSKSRHIELKPNGSIQDMSTSISLRSAIYPHTPSSPDKMSSRDYKLEDSLACWLLRSTNIMWITCHTIHNLHVIKSIWQSNVLKSRSNSRTLWKSKITPHKYYLPSIKWTLSLCLAWVLQTCPHLRGKILESLCHTHSGCWRRGRKYAWSRHCQAIGPTGGESKSLLRDRRSTRR